LEPTVPRLLRGLPRTGGAAPHLPHLRGNTEGAPRPAESFSRALDFVRAERRAVTLLCPCLARRAEADDGAAGDERGPIAGLGLRKRLGDRLRIVPIDVRRRPTGGLEALDLINGIRKRQRTVDRDTVIVEQHEQLVDLEMASWLTPSIRSPSEAST